MALPKKLNPRAAMIAAFVLIAVIILIVVIWSYPMILLYILLGVIGIMAYGAIYLIVSARMARDEHEDDDVAEFSEEEYEEEPPSLEETPAKPVKRTKRGTAKKAPSRSGTQKRKQPAS